MFIFRISSLRNIAMTTPPSYECVMPGASNHIQHVYVLKHRMHPFFDITGMDFFRNCFLFCSRAGFTLSGLLQQVQPLRVL